MAYNIGQTVTVQTVARTITGAPINTPTVTLTVTAPDGTTTTPVVTNTGAGGIYTATVAATQVGTYVLAWVGTGGLADVDQFTVRDAGARLISLADAKKHLNIPATTTTDDDELQDWIDTLTGPVEGLVGPMVRRTASETLWVDGPEVVLGYAPVISLTSVTAAQTGWSAPLVANLTVDLATGIVYYTAGGTIRGRLTVTYVVGRAAVPAEIQQAAKIILAHLWTSQHNAGGGRPAFAADELVPVPGFGFGIPRTAAEIIEHFPRIPSVA